MLAAEFTEGWNIVVTAAAGVLGAAVGGGATAWATTRAEVVRLREARSARLYESRTSTYRTLAHRIEEYRQAVMGLHLARSPAPLGDDSSNDAMVKVLVADSMLRSTLLEVRLVASSAVRKKAMALRDQLVEEMNAVKPAEQSSEGPLLETLEEYRIALDESWNRTRAAQEDLLDAISHELDLDPLKLAAR